MCNVILLPPLCITFGSHKLLACDGKSHKRIAVEANVLRFLNVNFGKFIISYMLFYRSRFIAVECETKIILHS